MQETGKGCSWRGIPAAGPTEVTPSLCPEQVGGKETASETCAYLTGLRVEQKEVRALIKSTSQPLTHDFVMCEQKPGLQLPTKEKMTQLWMWVVKAKCRERSRGMELLALPWALVPPQLSASSWPSAIVPSLWRSHMWEPTSTFLQAGSHITLWVMGACRKG